MKRIAIDMDGVLADVYSQFVKLHAERTGKIITSEEMAGRPEGDVFPDILSYIHSPGFFRNAPVMQDGKRVVERLTSQYEVYIVSAAMEFPTSLTEKQSWLNEHLPFIAWQQMVFCGSKQIIKADIMIDDHFKNLDYFTGETFLFTQPHNIKTGAGNHVRVDTWLDIERMLLP